MRFEKSPYEGLVVVSNLVVADRKQEVEETYGDGKADVTKIPHVYVSKLRVYSSNSPSTAQKYTLLFYTICRGSL
jgi:hypothetical protein